MKSLLLLAWFVFGIACRQQTVQDVLQTTVNKSHERTVDVPKHLLTVRYIPKMALLISRAGLEGDARVSKVLLDSLRKSDPIPEGLTFLLTLSPKHSSSPGSIENDVVYGSNNGFGNYEAALEAYQTGWREKIWIETDGRKIPLTHYQMENTFGMTASRNFTLLFPDLPATGNRRLKLVLDGLMPGMQREMLEFEIPMEQYAQSEQD